ncbi:MAG: hypothetical protein PHQ60_08660 [Sideroxydans sp.]|nr:hypothetical protein [Sideroxydans sp.]
MAKDSRMVVSWDMASGVEYWLYKAAGNGVTPENCSSMSACTTTLSATSPTTVSSVANGTTYSVSINGRISGGPGGPGSAAVSATPRMAGGTWTAPITNTIPNTTVLRGVAYGAMYVAVGDGGALYSGAVYTVIDAVAGAKTGITWSPLTNPLATNFNAVNYDSARAKYLSAGTGGAIISMTPASSTAWTQQTSNTTNDLYAIANNAAGMTVATGAGGTIISSNDGSTWTVRTSGTANALNAVTYGYDNTNAQYVFVAVGAGGTVLKSTDGITWTAASSGTANELRGVTYGAAAGVFVAVGASGTVLTSTDGTTWTPQTALTIATLNAVTYSPSRRFIAVGADGSIYYNEYANAGVTWTQAVTATGTALNAVAPGALFDYSAVGASGVNLYAD